MTTDNPRIVFERALQHFDGLSCRSRGVAL